jgi:hypothetical protein
VGEGEDDITVCVMLYKRCINDSVDNISNLILW